MDASLQERFRRVDAIFDAALDQPPAERTAYVSRACADDAALCTEVLRLLRAHAHTDGFLESPALELAAPLLPDDLFSAPEVPLVTRIGAFRVVREIGHGGMGAVYLGERDDGQFQQRVALKLIRMAAGAGFVRRFVEERRILAMLEHPGIARLIDGGVTGEGVPWFAMELVEGEPIDRFCDTRQSTIGQRLSLFARVCDAVQYAHQHLVVHRDLKPANIMVTAEGQVKLLDFGIARLLDQDARTPDQAPAYTMVVAMTPEYASPEQVRGQPVSTATDVYALGVLLYQMLTGVRPYDLRGHTHAEVERLICEVEPPAPSATFSTASEEAADRAAARNTTPDRLRRTLRGDLDVIVAKALAKEPADRYPSVTALQEDLRLFREGRPIVARPQSATYRLRKFVRRRRGLVAAIVAALVLVSGAAVRERALRGRAEAETRRARAVEGFMVSLFDVANPFARPDERGEDVTARALLERGAADIEARLATEPALRAELRGVLGRVYISLGMMDRAIPMLERTLADQRRLHGEEHEDVAEAMDALGQALSGQDRHEEAEALLRDALAMRRRLLGDLDAATASSLENLALHYRITNAYDAAEPLFNEAIATRRALPEQDEIALASTVGNLALLRWLRGDYAHADSLYREVYAIERVQLGEDHPKTAQTLHNMAQAAEALGNRDRADTLYRAALEAKRKSLGNAHPSVTINLNNLGRMLVFAGRADEAEPLIREALALDRQIFGNRHSYVGQSLNNLGFVLRAKGEFEEAERVYHESLALNLELFGEKHNFVALNYNEIANVMQAQGNLPAAIDYFRRSHALYMELLGAGHASTNTLANNLARVLRESGQIDEARALFEETRSRLDPEKPQERANFMTAQLGIGQILAARGAFNEARPLLEQALALARQHFGPSHIRTAEAELALGECFLGLREYAAAAPLIEAGVRTMNTVSRSQPRPVAQAHALLERLQRERG